MIKRRIDAFLFTKNTTIYELRKLNLLTKIKEAGCVSKANIYIAFTPKIEKRQLVGEFIEEFELKLTRLKTSGNLSKILNKYKIN